jgi:cation diffusion facilitator CzcD-associated flavoprotein CzcO
MSDTITFDPDALHAKYIEERDKRMRADGNAQYRDLSGLYEDFDKDPYVEPGFTRDPIRQEVDVCVVGGGLGGMMAAAELRRRGIANVKIIDKAGDFGGTWYWNRYPGAACDVESYIYLPYLEETGYIPVEKYSKATEIFAHCQRIARHFDLYPMAMFQTHVDDVRWDEASARWQVTTDRGDKLAARFTVIAGGVLHKAKLPGIPGIETFQGQSFHTSRWDYAITGGSPAEPMDKLAGKKVAIIGTGATGIQAVPKLGEAAGHLYVCQRTPSGVGVRANAPTDPEWVQSLQPGWQQERMDNFTAVVSGDTFEKDLVGDGWTEIFRELQGLGGGRTDIPPEEQQLADYRAMEAIRQRIDEVVADNATAEALKPWYNRMCKRPCFHDEYLPTFNRPNVTLLDTDGRGVERITENALVVGGKEYPVDVIIFASGFEVASDYTRRLGFDVHGRNELAMSTDWKQNGPHTLHGIFAHNYPNLLMFSTTQGGNSINFVHTMHELAVHAASVVDQSIKEGVRTIEATPEAEEAWWNEVAMHLMRNALFLTECTPSYYNGEGSRDPSAIKSAAYFGGTMAYVNILRDWRQQGTMPGLEKTLQAADA